MCNSLYQYNQRVEAAKQKVIDAWKKDQSHTKTLSENDP